MLGRSTTLDSTIRPSPKFEKVPESVNIITLDATAETEELIMKAMELQHRIEHEIKRLAIAQENHRLQAQENITLKEYVTVLLKSTNRLGTDRHGAPLPTLRRT
jgi:hypothetical protein